ncbi:hypothetical protein BJX61DRAFT_490862 [Aspergillus egyptiacus]|nr:hypothetical protein BJX61DRAFT_490862 [Aspergillus egyptiacus]
MGNADQKRFLSWLSRLGEAELVLPQIDTHPSAKFTYDGIPVEKQTREPRLDCQGQASQTGTRKRTSLELASFDQPYISSRPGTKGRDSCISRKEKHGYERIPRSRTKEDRYEYKGKSTRVNSEDGTTSQKRKGPKQKRKHTINEDFHASNVPQNRLTVCCSGKPTEYLQADYT